MCTTTALPAGTDTVTATYAQTTNFNGSSGSTTQAVDTVPSVPSGMNPMYFGQDHNDTYNVTSSSSPMPCMSVLPGTLPTGVNFSDSCSGTAILSGATTATPGNYNITITASNLVGSASQNFTLTVLPPPPPPSTPALLPNTTPNAEDGITSSPTPSFYGANFTNEQTGTVTISVYNSSSTLVATGIASLASYLANNAGVQPSTRAALDASPRR